MIVQISKTNGVYLISMYELNENNLNLAHKGDFYAKEIMIFKKDNEFTLHAKGKGGDEIIIYPDEIYSKVESRIDLN
jgi:hypothetical protein